MVNEQGTHHHHPRYRPSGKTIIVAIVPTRETRNDTRPMTPDLLAALALAVIAVHVAVIAFNIFGLIAIPLGSFFDWRFVRVFWWRALHLALLAVLVLQALFGRPCFLTLWQAVLEQDGGALASREPLIARLVESVIFWPLPIWFFAALYVGIWIYALALWRLVPPTRR
jgi:Protein of Unknown function (DUF2784)